MSQFVFMMIFFTPSFLIAGLALLSTGKAPDGENIWANAFKEPGFLPTVIMSTTAVLGWLSASLVLQDSTLMPVMGLAIGGGAGFSVSYILLKVKVTRSLLKPLIEALD